jgi:acyl-CoA thioester hydrolase
MRASRIVHRALASPAMTTPPVFELPKRVTASDLDELAHVNNVVYLSWVQEVATAHWRTLAPSEALEQLAWVARRHEIDYLASAVLDDALVLRTWVGVADGLQFERHTEVRHADGRLVTRARSLWIPIDPRTGRPRRPSAEVRALFSAASG